MGPRVLLLCLPLLAVGLEENRVIEATRPLRLMWSRGFVDVPEQVEQRLAPLRGVLPRYGPIGYIDPDHSWRNAAATRSFYLAQYVLAPRVIVYGSEPEYAIYTSHLGRPLTADLVPPGMKVVKQFGADLAVLIRIEP